MSLSLKNNFKSGVSACQACQVIDGKITDLSAFGVDFSEYVQLKCVSKNQKLDISINDKTAFSFDVPESPGKIVGISIYFEGSGSVKNVELKKKDEVVYASSF